MPDALEGRGGHVGEVLVSQPPIHTDPEQLECHPWCSGDTTSNADVPFGQQYDSVEAEHEMEKSPQIGTRPNVQGSDELQQQSIIDDQRFCYLQGSGNYLSALDPLLLHNSQPSFSHSSEQSFVVDDSLDSCPGMAWDAPNYGNHDSPFDRPMNEQVRSPDETLPTKVESYLDLSVSSGHSVHRYAYAASPIQNGVLFKPIGKNPWSAANMRTPLTEGSEEYGDGIMPSLEDAYGSGTSAAFEDTCSSACFSISLTSVSFNEDLESSVATIRGQHQGDQAVDYNPAWEQQQSTRDCLPDVPALVSGMGASGLPDQQTFPVHPDHPPFERENDCLAVPEGQGNHTCTSSTTPDVLRCEPCKVNFTGKYCRGSWQRHIRLKHRDQGVSYPCQDANCGLKFNRTDARLKHYRKYHPDLASSPAKPRAKNRRKSKENTPQTKKRSTKPDQKIEVEPESSYTGMEGLWRTTYAEGVESSRLSQDQDLLGVGRCVTPPPRNYSYVEAGWQDPQNFS